jgi:hypothetical protein
LIALLGILVTWWPVCALLHVPRLAQLLAVAIALRTKATLDHQIPDELPMTAGEWLTGRLAEIGYPIGTIVTDKPGNCYRPASRLIQLSEETHFKADPVYWATAAHELGHARLRTELPIIGWLRTTAIWAGTGLVATGIGLAFGRVLYGLPRAGEFAFGCFAVAATAIETSSMLAVTDVLSAFTEVFQLFSPFRIAHRLARDVKREDIPVLSRASDGRALLRVIEEGPDRSAKRVTRDEEEVATTLRPCRERGLLLATGSAWPRITLHKEFWRRLVPFCEALFQDAVLRRSVVWIHGGRDPNIAIFRQHDCRETRPE